MKYMSVKDDFFEQFAFKKIDISNKKDKYYNDYSDLPDDILIKYGFDWDEICDKSTFLKYQKRIIELKLLFRTCNLSPIEKLMIAYDIVKSKSYKISSNENLNGLPHEVLFGDFISCRGYCNLLIELLDSEGIKIANQSLNVFDKEKSIVDYHARCSVLLDDDKYNVHGLFVVSPTEDSYNERYKEYFGIDLQPTDLYPWFLKPLTDKELYHDDNYEYRIQDLQRDLDLFDNNFNNYYENCETRLNELIENNDLEELSVVFDDVFHGILDGMTKEKIIQYINVKSISFETLIEVVKNVRISCGYSIENLDVELARVSRVNSKFFSSVKNINLL